jgi:hypothetical protein
MDKGHAKLQLLNLLICMKQFGVKYENLAIAINAAVRRAGGTRKEVAKSIGVDESRLSRFCNADFKRATPVLKKVCDHFEIRLSDYALNGGKPPRWNIEISQSISKLVQKDQRRGKAIKQLLRAIHTILKT